MVDAIKRELDREWAEFVGELNDTYHSAKLRAIRAAAQLGTVERIDLCLVDWTDGEQIHVALGAVVDVGRMGGDDDRSTTH